MLRPDTDNSVDSGPTVASRATVLGGNATLVGQRRTSGQPGSLKRQLICWDVPWCRWPAMVRRTWGLTRKQLPLRTWCSTPAKRA